MNKRIKKIAERATVYREGLVDGKHDIEFFDKEKFAELIVRECIDCAVTVGHDDNRPIEPVYTIHEVKRQIQKHFGVEE